MPLQLTELIDEVKKSLGNRTDITDARYVRWLNWSLYEICGFHKKRMFTPPRFFSLEKKLLFSYTPETGAWQAADSTSITLAATASSVDDFYVDTVINVDSQDRLIVAYNGTTKVATIDSAWTTTPTVASTYMIYRKWFDIEDDIGYSDLDTLHAIERMEFASTGGPVTQKTWRSLINKDPVVYGTPSEFARYGDKIVFDTCIEGATTFRLYTYMFVTLFDVDVLTATSPLPQTWDECIVLGAIYRGFGKLMEPEREAQAKEDFLSSVINQRYYMTFEDKDKQMGVKVKLS
jgi:hypothetical protein